MEHTHEQAIMYLYIRRPVIPKAFLVFISITEKNTLNSIIIGFAFKAKVDLPTKEIGTL